MKEKVTMQKVPAVFGVNMAVSSEESLEMSGSSRVPGCFTREGEQTATRGVKPHAHDTRDEWKPHPSSSWI
jgi:hypothetical protein